MRKRIITGTGIVILLVGLFLAKMFWTTTVVTTFITDKPVTAGMLVFDLALLVMAWIGCFEMVRAFGERMILTEKIVAMCFPPVVFAVASFIGVVYTFIVVSLYVLLTLALFVFAFKEATLESVALTLLCLFYPTGLLLTLVAVNSLAKFEGLLIVFVTAPVCDTMAYFVGSALKGKKLCPEISPNKTISGSIGGIVGGMLGGVATYFLARWFYTCGAIEGSILSCGYVWLDVVIFALSGAVFAVLTEIGDLSESVIKRKLGIKDMGDILPGHGGMMDRIDGLLFVSPVSALIFCVILPQFII